MIEKLSPAEVFVSDLHVSPEAVADPGRLRPGVAFLGDPEAYRARYLAGEGAATARYALRPLSHRGIARNGFWSAYASLLPGERDPWSLQLPLVATPTEVRVAVDAPDLGLRLPVRCRVFVWPAGWAATLHARTDSVEAAALQALMARLRGHVEGPALTLNGAPGGVTRVFRTLAQQISDDLFTTPVDTSPTVPSTYVLGLADAAGEARPYRGAEKLPTVARRTLHALLLGRPVEVAELAKIESVAPGGDEPGTGAPGMHLTPLSGSDFAVTRFELGTLLLLTGSVRAGELSPRALHCLAANVRTVWLQSLLLAHTVNQAGNLGDHAAPPLRDLADAARAVLLQTSESRHLFTRDFSRSGHSALRRAVGW